MTIRVRKERLRKDVRVLTGVTPPGNYLNILSLDRAADYISKEFGKLGCSVTVQCFTIKARECRNVICAFGDPDAARVVVGAHYDVAGETPGADDNASGVAGLLEPARLTSETGPELRTRLDFVAYSLEEPPISIRSSCLPDGRGLDE